MADVVGGGNSSGGASYSFGVKGLLHRTIRDGEGNATASAFILAWHLDAPSGLIQGAVPESTAARSRRSPALDSGTRSGRLSHGGLRKNHENLTRLADSQRRDARAGRRRVQWCRANAELSRPAESPARSQPRQGTLSRIRGAPKGQLQRDVGHHARLVKRAVRWFGPHVVVNRWLQWQQPLNRRQPVSVVFVDEASDCVVRNR